MAEPTGCFVRTSRELMIRDCRRGRRPGAHDVRRPGRRPAHRRLDLRPPDAATGAHAGATRPTWSSACSARGSPIRPSTASRCRRARDAAARARSLAAHRGRQARPDARAAAPARDRQPPGPAQPRGRQGRRGPLRLRHPRSGWHSRLQFTSSSSTPARAARPRTCSAWADALARAAGAAVPLASSTTRRCRRSPIASPAATPSRAAPTAARSIDIRTNEIELTFPWELREFHISATTGFLQQAPVVLTPDTVLQREPAGRRLHQPERSQHPDRDPRRALHLRG